MDHRYAIDASKLARELDKRCGVAFDAGLRDTSTGIWTGRLVARRDQRRLPGLDRQEYGFRIAV